MGASLELQPIERKLCGGGVAEKLHPHKKNGRIYSYRHILNLAETKWLF